METNKKYIEKVFDSLMSGTEINVDGIIVKTPIYYSYTEFLHNVYIGSKVWTDIICTYCMTYEESKILFNMWYQELSTRVLEMRNDKTE